MIELKREYFDCICGSADHTVALCWLPEENQVDYYDDELWFEMQLHRETNIFKRAWNAIKYVFGRDYRSHWGECIISKDEAIRMRVLIDQFIESAEKRSS